MGFDPYISIINYTSSISNLLIQYPSQALRSLTVSEPTSLSWRRVAILLATKKHNRIQNRECDHREPSRQCLSLDPALISECTLYFHKYNKVASIMWEIRTSLTPTHSDMGTCQNAQSNPGPGMCPQRVIRPYLSLPHHSARIGSQGNFVFSIYT